MSRVVAYVSATRADYGLARWTLQDIVNDEDQDLYLIVTGAHLSDLTGKTVQEIETDGFTVDKRVFLDVSADDPETTARWMACLLKELTITFCEKRPDILLIIGDRLEALIAAQAAMLSRVPVVHVHGGEATAGSFDESIRHAITKLSHFHFAVAPEYARRIIQLGEDPSRVFLTTSPGLCSLSREDPVPREDLELALGFSISEPYVIATYHPETSTSQVESVQGVVAMLEALALFPRLRVVITGVNVDPGSSRIRTELIDFSARFPDRVTLIESLGHRFYLAALKSARLCIGNSSSGIIEAPALGVPTVNIGNRQLGRLRAVSVVDVPADAGAIADAINTILSGTFPPPAGDMRPPYGSGGEPRNIASVIGRVELSGVREKVFHDCCPECDSWSRSPRRTE